MATLLVVHHTVSPSLQKSLELVVGAAREAADQVDGTGLDVVVKPALSANATDVLATDAVLVGTPANIGYMSGALKHFFDQIYYPTLSARDGLPYGSYVHGNDDCAGALKSIERITTGLGWRRVVEPVILTGDISVTDTQHLIALGETMAAAALGLLPN